MFTDEHVDLQDISFSPNRVQFRASTNAESRIYLNERYVDGWQSDAGPVAVDQATGLAYVTAGAGTVGKFSFWPVPPGLVSGFVLFAIGAVVANGALFARRRWQARLRF